jgi:hypothetical protein
MGNLLQNGGIQPNPNDPNQANQQVPVEGGAGVSDPNEASSEDQDAYEQVVMTGMKVLFDEESTQKEIIEQLKAGGNNPAKSISDVSTMIITQLDKRSGGSIPETVILPAAAEILEQVSELAESADLFPVDEAVMAHAAQLMVVDLAEEYGVNQDEIQEMLNSTDQAELKQIEDEQGNFARKQPPIQAPNGEQNG